MSLPLCPETRRPPHSAILKSAFPQQCAGHPACLRARAMAAGHPNGRRGPEPRWVSPTETFNSVLSVSARGGECVCVGGLRRDEGHRPRVSGGHRCHRASPRGLSHQRLESGSPANFLKTPRQRCACARRGAGVPGAARLLLAGDMEWERVDLGPCPYGLLLIGSRRAARTVSGK